MNTVARSSAKNFGAAIRHRESRLRSSPESKYASIAAFFRYKNSDASVIVQHVSAATPESPRITVAPFFKHKKFGAMRYAARHSRVAFGARVMRIRKHKQHRRPTKRSTRPPTG